MSTQLSIFSEVALEVETLLSPEERRRGAGLSSLASFRSTLLVGSPRGGRNAVEEWIEEVGEACEVSTLRLWRGKFGCGHTHRPSGKGRQSLTRRHSRPLQGGEGRRGR